MFKLLLCGSRNTLFVCIENIGGTSLFLVSFMYSTVIICCNILTNLNLYIKTVLRHFGVNLRGFLSYLNKDKHYTHSGIQEQ